MVKLIKWLCVLALMLLLAAGLSIIWLIQSDPLVNQSSAAQLQEADSVKPLLNKLRSSLRQRHFSQQIVLTEQQLNALVGVVQRARPEIKAGVSIEPGSTWILASYKLPETPFGQYLNIHLQLLPGNGIVLEKVKVGSIQLPGRLALRTVVKAINWYTNSDVGTQLLKQVEQVSMHKQRLTVMIKPINDLLTELDKVKGDLSSPATKGRTERVAHYMKLLATLPNSFNRQTSLSNYMKPLFKEAQRRSQAQPAHLENEAALLALAAYAGNYRFGRLIGNVQPVAGKVTRPTQRPVLAERTDLSQHFIYSLAIKLLSEQGVSAAIGEFKELMDRARGGSGYSFVDLAADKAGIAFAMTATNTATAGKLQELFANGNGESLFFPDISGLPEGISKPEFERRFSQVDSPAYLQVVQEIDRRLATLPAYRL